MPVTLAGGCRVSEMREGEPVVHGTVRIWNQIGKETGAQAISLRVMEFAPGLSPGLRNGDCDEILYLLPDGAESAKYNSRGQARSAKPLVQSSFSDMHPEGAPENHSGITLTIDEKSYPVTADNGIYIRPGQTFSINNPNTHPVLLISSRCPDPAAAPEFVEHIAPSSSLIDS